MFPSQGRVPPLAHRRLWGKENSTQKDLAEKHPAKATGIMERACSKRGETVSCVQQEALHSQSVNMEFTDGIKKRRSGRVVSRGAQKKMAEERTGEASTGKDMVDC